MANQISFFSIFLAFFLFQGCVAGRQEYSKCTNHDELKYKVKKAGFIGENPAPVEDLCVQKGKEKYVGLTKACIKNLLGEPAENHGSTIAYYLGFPDDGMILYKLSFKFSWGRVIEVRCGIV